MAQYRSKRAQKSPPRQKSVFIFCEGDAEKKLWTYLKGWLRSKGVAAKCVIKSSKGGDCPFIVKEAARQHKARERETGAEFSVLIVMMDADNRYDEALSLIIKKQKQTKPIWKFVLSFPCLEQTIAELIGKGDIVSAKADKKQAIKQIIGLLPHEIDWDRFLNTYAKGPEDIFALPALKEVREFFFKKSNG